MKPRHVRRIIIALGVIGALLLIASCVLSLVDSYNLLGDEPTAQSRETVSDVDRDANHIFGADDPGGFRHFQDQLVRHKTEEMADRERERALRETATSRSARSNASSSASTLPAPSGDEIFVSEGDATRYIRAASGWNERRLQRVQEVCARHNLGLYRSSARAPDFKLPPTPQYAVFYYDRPHKMAWCPLYKAGSTTWLHSLCLLGGYSERELQSTKEQLSTLARKAFPELEYPDAEETLRLSRKILVVRHPFARLLSAYRDKLENRVAGAEHGTAHFYRKYGRRMVDKYRPGGARTPTSSVVRADQVVMDPRKEAPAGDEPTFKEFVQYLIDTDLANYADDHWIPYYLFCTPCLLNYDIIAKVETYLEDQVYMIRALGLQDQIRPRWKHRTSHSPSPSSSTSVDATAKKYFSQITRDDLTALYEKYKLDFELFDYAMEDYLPHVASA